MNNNLTQTLKKVCKKILFTTPSHSQKKAIFKKFKHFYAYDISETDAYNPTEALEISQKNASKIYKTKETIYLTNGSTSGVITAVLTCCKKDDKVLIWKNAHPCHKNAVELAGCTPIFYDMEINETWNVPEKIDIKKIETDLKEAKAIIVTSPTYEGFVSDISELKKLCEKYDTYLIADEAHGALYPFSEDLPTSAISKGADFVIQSLHKTAGGLNPTALLHNNTKISVKEAFNKIQTTSPSYPLLASIEKNINYLNSTKGKLEIKKLINLINNLKQNVKTVEFCNSNDPLKILIKKDGLTGEELSAKLYEQGIEDEKTNEKSVMLLCGIGTTQKMINRLEKVLKKL